MKFHEPPGSTPLDQDSLNGLIPDLKTLGELNEYEQINIARGLKWATKSRFLKEELTTIAGLQRLHHRMFDKTWRWAGKFRRSDTNIGVAHSQISSSLLVLCGDVKYQMEQNVYQWHELAVRFHHRLVAIHPFPNGNGRHARIAADLLLRVNGLPELTWGRTSLIEPSATRGRYIKALQDADAGSYGALLEFSQS